MSTKSLTSKQVTQFTKTVWEFYREHQRSHLPWRKTKNPYHIWVSEIMLQQTQVDRVLPKYQAFMEAFPKVELLARASLKDALTLWQGLGYNSRAKRLHECAKVIVKEYNRKFPKTYEGLQSLPGIGPYTAGAILAFAYNQAVPILETNIRTVYLHHFFKDKTDVTDKELVRYIVLTLDEANPREWYWALMDYGTYLKKEYGNPNSRSKSYSRQSAFAGSDRQIRGAIIRALTTEAMTRRKLHAHLQKFEDVRIDAQLEKLVQEGMAQKVRQFYKLPT